jgi:hypothetical protein
MTDVADVVTESVLLPCGGTVVGGGAWPASLQAAWLREPGSGARARPGPRVLR